MPRENPRLKICTWKEISPFYPRHGGNVHAGDENAPPLPVVPELEERWGAEKGPFRMAIMDFLGNKDASERCQKLFLMRGVTPRPLASIRGEEFILLVNAKGETGEKTRELISLRRNVVLPRASGAESG